MESAAHLRRDGATLVVAVEPGEDLIAAGLRREANRRLLDEAAAAVWGPEASWRVETVAPAAGGGARPFKPQVTPGRAAPPSPDLSRAEQHPAVQAVLEIFGGRVANVEPDEPPEGKR